MIYLVFIPRCYIVDQKKNITYFFVVTSKKLFLIMSNTYLKLSGSKITYFMYTILFSHLLGKPTSE